MDELTPELKARVAEYGQLIINGRLYVADPPEEPAKKTKDATAKEGE